MGFRVSYPSFAMFKNGFTFFSYFWPLALFSWFQLSCSRACFCQVCSYSSVRWGSSLWASAVGGCWGKRTVRTASTGTQLYWELPPGCKRDPGSFREQGCSWDKKWLQKWLENHAFCFFILSASPMGNGNIPAYTFSFLNNRQGKAAVTFRE